LFGNLFEFSNGLFNKFCLSLSCFFGDTWINMNWLGSRGLIGSFLGLGVERFLSFRENDELWTILSLKCSAFVDIVNRVKLIKVENFIHKIFFFSNLSWCGWCFDINKGRMLSFRDSIRVK